MNAFFVCYFCGMKIHFILVEPAVPENIGAAARAIKTMGFDSLRLVNPCVFNRGKAKWLAHASGEILDNAGVCPTLIDALKDVDFVVASSAKMRSVKGDHHPVEKLPELLKQKTQSIDSVAIVFGREESGLTNSEMQLCHISTFIPAPISYPSLNLSQAVMIYTYLLSKLKIGQNPVNKILIPESKFNAMITQVKYLLNKTKIGRNPIIYNRILERLALLADNDINLMMSVLTVLNKNKKS